MPEGVPASLFYQENLGGFLMMTVRNEIKAQIVRAGYTMQEVVDRLHEELQKKQKQTAERKKTSKKHEQER